MISPINPMKGVVNIVDAVRPAQSPTPQHNQRSKVTDKNAFNRMRKLVRGILSTHQAAAMTSVSKHLNVDDSLILHGFKPLGLGHYTVGCEVYPLVPELLKRSGIEHTVKTGRWNGIGNSIIYVTVPVDQLACPQPKKKRSAYAKTATLP